MNLRILYMLESPSFKDKISIVREVFLLLKWLWYITEENLNLIHKSITEIIESNNEENIDKLIQELYVFQNEIMQYIENASKKIDSTFHNADVKLQKIEDEESANNLINNYSLTF